MKAYGLTDAGPVRSVNEDRFLSDDQLGVFAVADGMGGEVAGAFAADMAMDAIETFVRRSHDARDFSWPFGVDPTLSFDANRLRTAVNLANRRIHRHAENQDEYVGIGTTIVAALASASRLAVAHVGDSRLYVLEDGTLTQVTEDDVWPTTVLTPRKSSSAGRSPTRHVLTRVLGAQAHTDIHVKERSLSGRETLLLCSDGLYGALSNDALAAALSSDEPLPTVVDELVDMAARAGSRDNITALVVRCRA